MSLFAQAKEAGAKAQARPNAPTQVTQTTTIDIANLEQLAKAIEKAYPGMTLNEAAITKAGLAPTGEVMVPFAAHDRKTKGGVTVYYNGKVVWTAIEPVKPAKA